MKMKGIVNKNQCTCSLVVSTASIDHSLLSTLQKERVEIISQVIIRTWKEKAAYVPAPITG